MKTARGDRVVADPPADPIAALDVLLCNIRAALTEALPVDEVAERELDAWLRTHERPSVKRHLVRRGRMTADAA